MESLEAVERSVLMLTPHADFLACIDNSGTVPKLQHFSSIDRSGQWSAIKARFAQTLPGPEDFPNALSPLFIKPVPNAQLRIDGPLRTIADGMRKGQWGELLVGGREFHVLSSPAAYPTLRGEAQKLAKLPPGTAAFVWVYPAAASLADFDGPLPELSEAEADLLTCGGFAFFNIEEDVLGIRAASWKRPASQPALMGFRPPMEVSSREAQSLPASRWSTVTWPHVQARGAVRFSFLMPGEKLAGRRISVSGGLVYEMETVEAEVRSLRYVFFPVESSVYE